MEGVLLRGRVIDAIPFHDLNSSSEPDVDGASNLPFQIKKCMRFWSQNDCVTCPEETQKYFPYLRDTLYVAWSTFAFAPSYGHKGIFLHTFLLCNRFKAYLMLYANTLFIISSSKDFVPANESTSGSLSNIRSFLNEETSLSRRRWALRNTRQFS